MIYTLQNRCFQICSSWSTFHHQLIFLRKIFQKNVYSENVIDRYFRLLSLNRIHILKEKIYTVEKKLLPLVLLIYELYHCKLGLNCKSQSKGYLSAVNYRLLLKVKINSNNVRFKDLVPQIITSGVVYKFQCGLCNESYYTQCVRHLVVRCGEHIGISPLNSKRVQSRTDSAVCLHLLNCNYSPTFEDFIVLCHENKKYLERKLSYNERYAINESKRTFHPTLSI